MDFLPFTRVGTRACKWRRSMSTCKKAQGSTQICRAKENDRSCIPLSTVETFGEKLALQLVSEEKRETKLNCK